MALQGIEVEGVIIKEYPPREGVSRSTNNPWKLQEFVIQTKDTYPRACAFTVFGADRLEQFNLHQGDTVHVWLDINARQGNGSYGDRYFNDIRAFRVDHIDPNSIGTGAQTTQTTSTLGQAPSAAGGQTAQPAQPTQDPLAGGGSQDDANDLPF